MCGIKLNNLIIMNLCFVADAGIRHIFSVVASVALVRQFSIRSHIPLKASKAKIRLSKRQ
jgi:hypothetical protein